MIKTVVGFLGRSFHFFKPLLWEPVPYCLTESTQHVGEFKREGRMIGTDFNHWHNRQLIPFPAIHSISPSSLFLALSFSRLLLGRTVLLQPFPMCALDRDSLHYLWCSCKFPSASYFPNMCQSLCNNNYSLSFYLCALLSFSFFLKESLEGEKRNIFGV